MPFTPSHAVVALPFLRTPLVPAAVAVGAMAPDLPLFVRVFPLGGDFGLHYGRTHALEWLPVTVLLALLLLLVWRCALRPAVRELSPRWLAVRLPGDWDRGAAAALRETFGGGQSPLHPAWLVLSATIGVVTHILWDAFSHEGRWGVQLLPLLGEMWGPLRGYKWLQYVSGAVGLIVVGVWALRWLRGRRPDAVPQRVLPQRARIGWWWSLPVLLFAAAVAATAAHLSAGSDAIATRVVYGALVPVAGVWGALTMMLCVLILVLRAQRERAAR